MKIGKRTICTFLVLMMLLAAFPVQVFAAGKIQPDQNVSFTISYQDGETAVTNANFRLYRVADVDEYARMTLTEQFETYQNSVAGLANLDDLDQEQWLTLASTLKGYAQADGLTVAAAGATDEAGVLNLTVKPGLYLVLGYRATTADYYTYSAVPFMAFLPGMNEEENAWNYDVTAYPKFGKEYNPQDDPEDEIITRKVLKIWDDEGFESIRPGEVVIQLLRDGEPYETVALNERNNWRFAWDNLEAKYEWDVVEQIPEDYAVTLVRTGVTFSVTNKHVVPITSGDPPVQKRVIGDRPASPGKFSFVMEALKDTNPMPVGSRDSVKVMRLDGPGRVEFGEIIFTDPGVYEYVVYEQDNNEDGYTYDDEVYTVRYDVVQEDGELICTRTITDSRNRTCQVAQFTNVYKIPNNRLPQTGMMWWPVLVLLLAGMFFIGYGVIRRRRNNG